MGIRQLENQRTADHQKFIKKATYLINKVKDLQNELQKSMKEQETKSQQLISTTHIAYKTGYLVLHDTNKWLRWSLTTKQNVDEILHLTKGIFQTLFNHDIPYTNEMSAHMATQLNTTF